jgi:hypothetical protein
MGQISCSCERLVKNIPRPRTVQEVLGTYNFEILQNQSRAESVSHREEMLRWCDETHSTTTTTEKGTSNQTFSFCRSTSGLFWLWSGSDREQMGGY